MLARCRDLEVAWFEWGRGEPLVLVHGLADDHRAWRKVLPWLTLDYRVIAYDLRGHGQTSAGTPEGTLAQLVGDLVALLDALEIEQAHLVGFSLGGTIVMRTAIDRPERVNRLLPVATSSRVGRTAADWYRQRAELADQGAERLHPVLKDDTRAQFASSPVEFEDHWRIRRQSTADPRGFANGCRAMVRLNAEPLDPELERIKAPSLVVSAELDQHCPPVAGQIIVERLPGARLELIGGSGHQVEVEQPERLSAAILGFLAGQGDPG
jgi:pimeloyl-ACP methyl ester carboxylesterase